MPRIVIAGCGYVGQAAADLFHAAGWEVEGWTASAESAEALARKPYRVVARDISDIAAEPEHADVVLQCVSSGGGTAEDYRRVYLTGATNLLRAFPRATLLFTSSTSVYAQRDGEAVTEESPAEPARETGRVLVETERIVLAHGGIVARLAGIYGPDRSFLLQNFLSGRAVMDAGNQRILNHAHRDDIAAALFLLARKREELSGNPTERIFNVVDDVPMTLRECYEWLAVHFGRPVPPTGTSATARKRGDSNKRVSNARLRALGWAPQYPSFKIGIEQSVIPTWNT